MNEAFYSSDHLAKDKLQTLSHRSNQPALNRFLVLFASIIATSVWSVLAWNWSWWNCLFAGLAFGLTVCSTFACLHETAHGTAFKSKRLNRTVAFLCGLIHGYPPSLFRELHFAHHRHTHTPGLDPEISLGTHPAPSVISNLPMYLGWLSGLPLILFKVAMVFAGAVGMPESMRSRLYPFVRPKQRALIASESWAVLAFQGSLVLLAVFFENGWWSIFLGQVIGHCMLAAYLTPEHNGLPHEGNILQRTRSIDTNRWIKWWMWNMPYHAEHHAFPAVPFHALPELRREIEGDLLHRQAGYVDFHRQVMKRS